MISRPRFGGFDASISRSLRCLSRGLLAAGLALLLGVPAATAEDTSKAQVRPVDFTTFTDLADSALGDLQKMTAWKQEVPEIREVRIPSSSGGEAQPALFYDSGSREPRPLLVALHSWTADYQKEFSIPYGAWAAKNDWVMIHPNYRGQFDRPEATLSDGAVEDILEALDWATVNAAVDKDRIYITGFSGGAMAALLMAGRYPELWTAVVAWVPVYDLVEWYSTVHEHTKLHYASDIIASCGGKPLPDTAAAKECTKRSPSTYLSQARGHDVDVLIAVGIEDWFVPPAHGMWAYNALAEEDDQLSAEE
ncbi:MAG: prolyl oligopeptidase family serine peptidase, partial [Acidobacteriota bacterium]|nr:prolyl oligopeptidase family serine peptidase [Acidobacteriota bacterium]